MPRWSQPLLGAKACDWSRKRDGGKSLIKQIISCWGREQLHFRAPLLERWKPPPLNFHALRAQSPLHRRRVSSVCGRAQSHRHPPLTCQDVHASGGPLLRFYPPYAHEVLLLLVSLRHCTNSFIFIWIGQMITLILLLG